jgi:hypothetical protein
MVTVAENHGQHIDTVEVGGMGRRVVLRSRGGFPVLTRGKASTQPTSVWLNGKKLVDVYLHNGTWELLVDREAGTYAFASDTPNIRFHLQPDEPERPLMLTRYLYGREPLTPSEVTTNVVYPGFSKYILLTHVKR